MTTPKKPDQPGRYDIDDITARVDREREAAGYGVKEMAAKIGMTEWTWYKRIEGSHPFKVTELGRIADVLNMPPFWPFAERSLLERMFPKAAPHAPQHEHQPPDKPRKLRK